MCLCGRLLVSRVAEGIGSRDGARNSQGDRGRISVCHSTRPPRGSRRTSSSVDATQTLSTETGVSRRGRCKGLGVFRPPPTSLRLWTSVTFSKHCQRSGVPKGPSQTLPPVRPSSHPSSVYVPPPPPSTSHPRRPALTVPDPHVPGDKVRVRFPPPTPRWLPRGRSSLIDSRCP